MFDDALLRVVHHVYSHKKTMIPSYLALCVRMFSFARASLTVSIPFTRKRQYQECGLKSYPWMPEKASRNAAQLMSQVYKKKLYKPSGVAWAR